MFRFRPSPAWDRLTVLRRIDWRPLLIAAWGFVLLSPLRETGWLSDDLFNASLPGLWMYRHVSPLHAAADDVVSWAIQCGRASPGIQVWKVLAFWLFPKLYWYKWAQLAAVLAALLVFYGCLRGMGAEANLAALVCLLAAGLVQFRALADPVLAFDGVLPFLMGVTSLSVLLLHRHRVTGGRLALIGSVLLYAAAALTYEMTYLFWGLHAWVLVRSRAGWRRGALTLAPFVSIPILLGAASLYLHTLPTVAAGEYRVHFDAAAMGGVFLKQFVAAFPCSYAGLDRSAPVKGLFAWATFRRHAVLLTAAFLLYGGLTWGLIRRARDVSRRPGVWAGLGLLLAVLPIPVLCACGKYQDQFPYGFGYLPVYIQYFGVALLLTAGAAALGVGLRRFPAWLLAPAAAVPCAAFTVLHYAANAQVVAAHRTPYLFPRREMEEVIDAGLLQSASPGAALVIDRIFPWELYNGDLYFYCLHGNTPLGGVLAPPADADALRRLVPDDRDGGAVGHDAVRLRFIRPAESGSFAVAGRLRYARLGLDGRLTESGLQAVRLAVWRGEAGDPLRDRPFIFHSCCWRQGGDPHRVDPVDLPSGALRWVRTTDHWAIYEIDANGPDLDGEAAWLEFPAAGRGGP